MLAPKLEAKQLYGGRAVSKETNQAKVKVIETKGVEFEGEYCVVPTKIEIGGQTYLVDFSDDVFGEVRDAAGFPLELEELRDIRLGEIPSFITIICDSTAARELGGELKLQKGLVSLEIMDKPKYHRGFIPIDLYFDAIKKIGAKMGLEILNEVRDENLYLLELLAKDFSEDATVAEVYKSFEGFTVKINSLERLAEAFLNFILILVEAR